jgi:hypothetical protein
VSPSAVGGIAVDGTTAVNRTNLVLASQVIADWTPGAALWLVWEMADLTGKAQGLAIDNLSFSATAQSGTVGMPVTFQSTATNLVLSWSSAVGQSYQLEYKDDLGVPSWTPSGGTIPGTGGMLSLTNDFTGSLQRFYRLHVLP